MRRTWTISQDLLLSQDEITKLYQQLLDAKDLAIQRKRNLSHIRDYFILRTLLETGVRVFELINIKIEDIRGRSLVIQRGKCHKKRNILLTSQTQRLLKEFLDIKKKALKEPVSNNEYLFLSERGAPYSTRGVRKRVKLWFNRCGFSDHLSCHSCRHTYISHLLASGTNVVLVRDNAGHSSLAVTNTYSHVVKSDLDELELYSSAFNGSRNNSRTRKRKP